MARIVLVDAHPDPDPARYCHALCDSYAEGARAGGHDVERIDLAELSLPPLVTREDWEHGAPPVAIRAAQEKIRAADHLVIVFPLWLGDMPAMLKAFLEQTLRPGFAFEVGAGTSLPRKLLSGKSARVVVTMGMPAFLYRWYFRAHSLRNLKRNILGFVGIRPVSFSIIGGVEAVGDAARRNWLAEMNRLGRAGK
jgi:putative NADPH-quinone reductase